MDIVKAKSQCGLDKAIKEGKTVEVHEGFYIVKQGIILAYGQSTVEAYDQSTVEAYDQSTVRACGQSKVEAYDQSKVEACGQSKVEACGQSTVEACGQSTVEAYDQSTVEAYDQSTVRAYGQSTVGAYDQSTVRACGQSKVEACGQSKVEACGQSTVEACGQSTVEAYGQSTVRAYDQSTVRAYGQSTVEAYDQSTVEAYGNAGCIIHSPNAKAKGNILDLSKYPQTPEDWLKSYGVEIKSGYAILFKGTQKDFGTRNNVKYVPGSRVIAPGWLEENIECGNALHFCPAPFICKRFIEEPKHFVACKVAVKDIRVYQGTPSYPDKIRAKQCEALYECDINGNEIKAK